VTVGDVGLDAYHAARRKVQVDELIRQDCIAADFLCCAVLVGGVVVQAQRVL
jgi:hypothetical protein